MPLFILGLTIAIVLGALLRQWAKTASDEDKKKLRRVTLWTVAVSALIALILTGRFFHALGWVVMIVITLLVSGSLSKRRKNKGSDQVQKLLSQKEMSIEEAYAVLELPTTASKKDIQDAYVRLISEHHPDHKKTQKAKKEATQKSEVLNKAYDILMDPNRPPED